MSLVIALAVVVLGGVVFVGAVSGWFDDKKVDIDEEYRGNSGIVDISVEEYESLVEGKRSFIVLVDQNGCNTADKMRDFASRYSEKNSIGIYRIMFEKMKNTSLSDSVKYYPSVVVIDDGEVSTYLKADSDDDAEIYNNYDSFEAWMNKNIEL